MTWPVIAAYLAAGAATGALLALALYLSHRAGHASGWDGGRAFERALRAADVEAVFGKIWDSAYDSGRLSLGAARLRAAARNASLLRLGRDVLERPGRDGDSHDPKNGGSNAPDSTLVVSSLSSSVELGLSSGGLRPCSAYVNELGPVAEATAHEQRAGAADEPAEQSALDAGVAQVPKPEACDRRGDSREPERGNESPGDAWGNGHAASLERGTCGGAS